MKSSVGSRTNNNEVPTTSASIKMPVLTSQQPNSLHSLDKEKITTFVVGTQKKSRFQKARENAELKRKVEETETASVYESFVASFTESAGKKRKGGSKQIFVRSSSSSGSGGSGRCAEVESVFCDVDENDAKEEQQVNLRLCWLP